MSTTQYKQDQKINTAMISKACPRSFQRSTVILFLPQRHLPSPPQFSYNAVDSQIGNHSSERDEGERILWSSVIGKCTFHVSLRDSRFSLICLLKALGGPRDCLLCLFPNLSDQLISPQVIFKLTSYEMNTPQTFRNLS